MLNILLVCSTLVIYPTVCVEWVAETNVVYNLYESDDLEDWHIIPAYSNYTTDRVVTNRMWRGKSEGKAFFALGSNNVVTMPAIVFKTNTVAKTNSPPPLPEI
jgi:hypothetical protein